MTNNNINNYNITTKMSGKTCVLCVLEYLPSFLGILGIQVGH